MKPEKSTDRTTLQFKVCLWCGHLQNPQIGMCDICGAGKIGLGKPRELWAYLDFKIESVLKLPEPLSVAATLRITNYTIFQENGITKARNNQTGIIEFAGTDAAAVRQNAINAQERTAK